MNYQQLTLKQRYQIEAGIGTGMRKNEIAREIGVHRSTVYREIRRNSNLRLAGYRAISAFAAASDRHEQKKKRCIEEATWVRVTSLLKKLWSPEQISNRLKLEGHGTISHESIYLYVYKNKKKGGEPPSACILAHEQNSISDGKIEKPGVLSAELSITLGFFVRNLVPCLRLGKKRNRPARTLHLFREIRLLVVHHII